MEKGMHAEHQIFLDAIAARRRLSVQFVDRKAGRELVRTCASLDFGPLRGPSDGADRYQFWDLEAKRKPYNLALLPADIVKMTPLAETFEPAEFITWAFKPGAWRIPRDWAAFS
jgi:hypothetical protein